MAQAGRACAARRPLTVFGDSPVLCGHRGSGRGPGENTPASFEAAVAAGLPWVEVDARRTADDVLVARHDPVTEDGRVVAETAAADTGLMRVADLLDELPPEVAVNVDVKPALDDALRPRERTTAALAARLASGRDRTILVTSFDPATLLVVRELAPRVPLGLITWTGFPLDTAVAAAAHLGVEVLVAHVEAFTTALDAADAVRTAHAAGLEVGAWCPQPGEHDALLALGVDCLVIDLAGDGEPGETPPP